MSENINNILSEIKKLSTLTEVTLPCASKVVRVSPLTLAQQKSIIEISADTSLSVLFFNTTIYKILEQNVAESTKNYNTIDRAFLCLSLRAKLNDIFKQDGKEVSITETIQKNLLTFKPIQPASIESESYKFTIRPPSVDLDNRINSTLLKKYKDDSLQGNKLKLLIGDLYTHEILKFISSIELKTRDLSFDIENNIQTGISVIESIDSKEFISIVEYINKVRDAEKLLTFVQELNTYIEIIPEFFVV